MLLGHAVNTSVYAQVLRPAALGLHSSFLSSVSFTFSCTDTENLLLNLLRTIYKVLLLFEDHSLSNTLTNFKMTSSRFCAVADAMRSLYSGREE